MWSRLDASTTNIESGWSVYVTSPNGTTILEINWDVGKGKLPATYLKQSLLTPPPPPLTPSPPNLQAQNSPCEWRLGWQQLRAAGAAPGAGSARALYLASCSSKEQPWSASWRSCWC